MKNTSGQGFGDLWTIYRGLLAMVCRDVLRNFPEEIEDAMSETMLRALRAYPRTAPRLENPGAWLATIAMNVCRDIIRKQRRIRPGLDVETLMDGPPGRAQRTTEHLFLERELRSEVKRTIHALPERLRRPFLLYLKRTSHRDIARSLKISPAASRKRIQRAKEYIQCELGRREQLPDDPAFFSNIAGLFDELPA